ncbi:hypothetical protein ABLU31_14500, partial [Acinetobacter seifertii]
IRQTSYPSCNLNFSNLGKLCRQRLYATKPFADDDLENIYSIVIRQQKTDEEPDFIKKLREIMTLRLEVEYKVIVIPPEEMK